MQGLESLLVDWFAAPVSAVVDPPQSVINIPLTLSVPPKALLHKADTNILVRIGFADQAASLKIDSVSISAYYRLPVSP